MDNCKHPPQRLFSWLTYDNTLCIGCCDCGEVISGAVDVQGNDIGPQIRLKNLRQIRKST